MTRVYIADALPEERSALRLILWPTFRTYG